MKSIYLKIRYLVDAGAIIIGHGLHMDFKMLNIAVPDSQIIDTVEIYRLPGKRFMSLQYLAYHVLSRNIQYDEHDSIEDATTALDLYRYCFVDNAIVHLKIQSIVGLTCTEQT